MPALEDGAAELVVIGVDPTADDPGPRLVDMLLDRGHEGEEGVLYLLPFDLGVRYERTGDRLSVLVLTSPQVLDHTVSSRSNEDLTAAAAHLRAATLVDGGVPLLRREIPTDFDHTTDNDDHPVVLLVQEGPATEQTLFAAFDEDEAALAVIGPWSDTESTV
ncbi:MAG TPA: hypothetical protein VFV67_14525 [Actinophytocola sp.]|uniref:hypothetical protein n=1 Tax=Actinophytocola sp. TaxID=1872138 RepID=UPI002DB9986A|nr:hypothetical protein [Actinophytocola sp.]HEU5471863.1 hypothetical protein [Actinophytocola sp.]